MICRYNIQYITTDSLDDTYTVIPTCLADCGTVIPANNIIIVLLS